MPDADTLSKASELGHANTNLMLSILPNDDFSLQYHDYVPNVMTGSTQVKDCLSNRTMLFNMYNEMKLDAIDLAPLRLVTFVCFASWVQNSPSSACLTQTGYREGLDEGVQASVQEGFIQGDHICITLVNFQCFLLSKLHGCFHCVLWESCIH